MDVGFRPGNLSCLGGLPVEIAHVVPDDDDANNHRLRDCALNDPYDDSAEELYEFFDETFVEEDHAVREFFKRHRETLQVDLRHSIHLGKIVCERSRPRREIRIKRPSNYWFDGQVGYCMIYPIKPSPKGSKHNFGRKPRYRAERRAWRRIIKIVEGAMCTG